VDYLDFEVQVSPGNAGEYAVAVRSEYGDASGTMRFPFDTLALQNRLQALQIALLRSASPVRRAPTAEEEVAQSFGRELFDALFAQGALLGRFEAARDGAWERQVGLRVRLRIDAPELAALPWEYLYDTARGDFLGLSISTPVVRYVALPRPVRPLAVTPPIRILGLIAESADLPSLDSARERQRLESALAAMTAEGLIELEWLPVGTWRALQTALLDGPWHVFHFVGHGGFDKVRGEGFVYLSDEGGRAARMSAANLGRLLGDHEPMRLAVLNSCEGASGDDADVFSSTAAALVKRGTPGVIAMQYPITDRAAIEFSRSFYGTLANGSPVDTALAVARKSISFEVPDSLEWGTPALFLRAPDGVLFEIAAQPVVSSAGRPVREVEPGPGLEAPVKAAIDLTLVPPPVIPAPPVQTPIVAAPAVSARVADPTLASGSLPAGQSRQSGPSSMRSLARNSLVAMAFPTLYLPAWRSGHIQVLVGWIVGAVVGRQIGYDGIFNTSNNVAIYGAGWLVAAMAATVALSLTRRPGVRLTFIAMVLLTPVAFLLGLLSLLLALLARSVVLWWLGRKKAKAI
jgi:hypothetical protein